MRSGPSARFYKPRGIPLRELETVTLKDEEWEAIKLADYRDMAHEDAAVQMGVSRPTFSRVLRSARKAVAKALAEGTALEIGGGDFHLIDESQNQNQNNFREENMKIVFTTGGDNLSAPMEEKFGRCPNFLVYDTGSGQVSVIENASCGASGGAGIKAAEAVYKSGAKAVITGECGPKAANALKQAGIKIYCAGGVSLREALEQFLAGELQEMK